MRLAIILAIPCLGFSAYCQADSEIEKKLSLYQDFLIKGTYEGEDWSAFDPLPKSRYDTFKMAFEHFERTGGKRVVELGTSRSFTHGGLPGCNLDDVAYWTPEHPENWDWGAGFFTRMCAISLQHLTPEFHTVDLISSHIERCQVMTREFIGMMTYHVANSLDFLQEFEGQIDLLYLDTGDMTPIEPTALLQLEEARLIVERNLIADDGIILIDDVRNQTPKKFGEESDLGKSKYSLPYFLVNDFEMIANEYQVILKKRTR